MKQQQWQWLSTSARATQRLGYLLGQSLRPGQVVALVGPLGVGKTAFVQGCLAGLEVAAGGRSPTFTLLHPYTGRLEVIHVDVYRLEDATALRWLGWDDYMERGAVALVEWADRAQTLLPAERLTIELAYDLDLATTQRRLTLTATGDEAIAVLSAVRAAMRTTIKGDDDVTYGDDDVQRVDDAILAFDTAGQALAVGAFAAAGRTAQWRTIEPYQHSRLLIQAVEQALLTAQVTPSELTLIAVTQGPGSYTGLRLGAMAAKTLAWAWQLPLVGVNSLAVLALPVAASALLVNLPARRGQSYVQAFADGGHTNSQTNSLHALSDVLEGDTHDVLAQLGQQLPTRTNWLLIGPGWSTIDTSAVSKLLKQSVTRGDTQHDWPQAWAVAELARRAAANGATETALTYVPRYASSEVAQP